MLASKPAAPLRNSKARAWPGTSIATARMAKRAIQPLKAGSPGRPMLTVPARSFRVSLSLFLLCLRFEDAQRRVAGVGSEGAGSRIFRFRRQGLAAVADADRFFFRSFHRPTGRPGAGEQNYASENGPRGSLPVPGHPTVLRYDGRF